MEMPIDHWMALGFVKCYLKTKPFESCQYPSSGFLNVCGMGRIGAYARNLQELGKSLDVALAVCPNLIKNFFGNHSDLQDVI